VSEPQDDEPERAPESGAEMIWRLMPKKRGSASYFASGAPRGRLPAGESRGAAKGDSPDAPGGELSAEEIHDLQRQIIATFIGLTRICSRRRCRRQRRCVERGAPCLDRHAGAASERLHAFLWRR
jgi:hypothetical protein